MGHELKTIKSWFNILETSFVIFLLQPHHKNYSKRIVKTPKLYFYDTGFACSLLGIKDEDDVKLHWAKGALFENMIIADIKKIIKILVRFHHCFFFGATVLGMSLIACLKKPWELNV
ncbi:MAG: DUF4143 domain-containing protein [Ginsengibacter sp.]